MDTVRRQAMWVVVVVGDVLFDVQFLIGYVNAHAIQRNGNVATGEAYDFGYFDCKVVVE